MKTKANRFWIPTKIKSNIENYSKIYLTDAES